MNQTDTGTRRVQNALALLAGEKGLNYELSTQPLSVATVDGEPLSQDSMGGVTRYTHTLSDGDGTYFEQSEFVTGDGRAFSPASFVKRLDGTYVPVGKERAQLRSSLRN